MGGDYVITYMVDKLSLKLQLIFADHLTDSNLKIMDTEVSQDGLPILCLSDGSAYLFSKRLQNW